jgi:hypothetical protein
VEPDEKTDALTDNREPLRDPPAPPDGPSEPEEKHYCAAHPDTLAFKQCPVCKKHFCPRCLVHYFGTYYCEKCGASQAPQQPEATRRRDRPTRSGIIPTDSQPLPLNFDESPQARRAMRLALIGLIPLLGLVLDVMALVAAFKAFTELGSIRGMRGGKKAVLAMAIAIVWLPAQLVGIFLVAQHFMTRL